MTVILQIKATEKIIAVEDVINFKMDTARFWLKLKEDRFKTYYRRHVRLMRIVEEEELKDE